MCSERECGEDATDLLTTSASRAQGRGGPATDYEAGGDQSARLAVPKWNSMLCQYMSNNASLTGHAVLLGWKDSSAESEQPDDRFYTVRYVVRVPDTPERIGKQLCIAFLCISSKLLLRFSRAMLQRV